jgi:hypothetical protein
LVLHSSHLCDKCMGEISAFRLESKSCKGFLEKINFTPMKALEFITGHIIYDLAHI